jgi:hypothetical protein
MYKASITKEKFNVLKKNVEFINAIRLLRIDSAIAMFESLMYRALQNDKKTDPKDDTSRDKRDRLEIVQYYGAVLYESIKTMYQMKGQLEQLNEYKNHINDINYLFDKEFNDPHSFTTTILKKIRNKLTFHFDEDVIREAILNIDSSDKEVTIIEGDSERNFDVNYPIIPTLYFNYLISYVKGDSSDEDKLRYIYDQMNLIAKKLQEFTGSIASELLKDKIHLENTK